MSGEMAWRVVPRDFAIINALPPEDQANSPPFEDRLFFPFVDMDTLPFDEVGNPLPDAQDAIRTNLVYLNKRLLGLTYSENHPEIDMAYELFVSALALQTPGVGAGSSASVEQGEINAKSAWELAQGLTPPARRVVTHDTYGTLGAWKVIIDYLLSDYFFLHQALPEPGGVP